MSVEPLVARTRAAQTTLDVWSKRPMKLGTADCVRMVAAHLRLLGYKVKLPPSGSYRTVNSAFKTLKTAGYETVADALDAMGLERIAPASAIVGDIVMTPAAHELGSFGVVLSNGRIVSFHEHADCAVVLQPFEYSGAWRANPRDTR